MSLATYSDLQAAVASFLHRSDLTAVIPDFISLAEVKINGDIDCRKQDSIATIATVASQEYVAMPSDLINVRAMVNATSAQPMVYKAPDAFSREFISGYTGSPVNYTIVGDKFYFAPVPDGVYSIRLAYQAKVPALSSGTNWLITAFPSVYLYATLSIAAANIKDDAALAKWAALYDAEIAKVNALDWSNAGTITVKSDVKI